MENSQKNFDRIWSTLFLAQTKASLKLNQIEDYSGDQILQTEPEYTLLNPLARK